MPARAKKSALGELLSGVSKLGLDALSTTLVELLPVELPEKEKRRLRRVARQGVAKTAKAVSDAARAAATKRAERKRVTAQIPLTRLQVITACRALGMEPPREGTPVDLRLAQESKRAAARLYHPDVVGNDSKRDQYEVVVRAYEVLEKYDEALLKKSEGVS